MLTEKMVLSLPPLLQMAISTLAWTRPASTVSGKGLVALLRNVERDISYVVAKAEHGATTVAGTLTIADAFGVSMCL